jgi:hypothetical protein
VVAPVAVAGLGEVFGLKKSARVFFAGDADAAGLAAGLAAAAAAVVFLRVRFAFGEAAGDSAAEGDVALSAGEAVAEVFFDARCFFAGTGDSLGDSAGAGD